MPALITRDLVMLDADLGPDRKDVIRALATSVVDAGRATEVESLFADAWAREQKTDTGLGGGIAIPHCRSASVTEPTLAFARVAPKVDFGGFDGPADIVFMIAAPAGGDELHLQLLAKLARSLVDEDFVAALRSATTADEIVALVERATSDEQAPAPAAAAAAGSSDLPLLVGVTSCATGIAHTYMAADALTNAARKLGAELHIETQGSAGMTPLDPALIARAGAVIFANDVDVRDRGRFAGKPVVQAPVKRGIDHPEDMVREALAAAKDPNAQRVQGAGAAAQSTARATSPGAEIKRILLTGVSYMIPFVAGGGLLIAIGFLLAGIGSGIYGYQVVLPGPGNSTGGLAYNDWAIQNFSLANLPPQGLLFYLGAAAAKIGQLSLGFLVPALSGYIAYAIADRPGIAPGFVVGAVSGYLGAGFIGGIVGGLLAGYTAKLIGRPAVPRWLRGLMPVVIIPLLASIVASGLMILVLGGPIAALTKGLNEALTGLSGGAAIVLGVILGLMMCFDLGGPINKVAYAFAVAGLASGTTASLHIMATVMAAGMVPPIGMAFASTVLYRKGFTQVERENGAAAWLLGASFISEGAIPFAAADPLRVIPSNLVGGAITGALTMAFGVTSRAPHGGIFVFFAIDDFWLWALSILIGAAVTGFVLVGLKRFVGPRAPRTVEEPALASSAQPVAA
ncbi:PTS fructose transporter subunit IIABC [Amnibacterium kyonggiense]|uniref:PTS system D-fructose-specific IIA component (F1P-forming) (Frc family) /PTS system D-fructose-specific IIB component (F1P-forming) (Frc family) /PTS system D-fructose-specific IIC component (F1P-f... n=1 Tax=Amnibacterium kyonggiense TaxID=595671 RepID=A0A4R7FKV1_9MICO|nr:fructose-specific PTS transporter subunit EIIC [Amnibacterium kyonggiense]TDS76996.1 PTS system D-fructose-specific IIA component (F1P-forming) (Frc family) /PTS system D-fructose-specific IIB component (F1P-forming) (Frc family) /PTS system D-fructose-specific IIC component (F1P-forming) (Frc family) [Amnibacterium kyonggiense]